jgi:uncharacterized protein (DUF1015 family)
VRQHGGVADLRPFRALRPRPFAAAAVAAPPYDVVDVDEARALAAGNPDSFLHVTRPEIDLDLTAAEALDPAAHAVHAAGRRALEALVTRGVLVQDAAPTYYVYRQRRGDHEQTGVVGCASVADYRAGVIRTHEHTRPDKEDDRVRHLDALGAHDEPVFLLAAPDEPGWSAVGEVVARVVARPPLFDLVTDDGIRHVFWSVHDPDSADDANDPTDADRLRAAFTAIPLLYVADGHHRSAAAERVSRLRSERNGSPDESDVFPVVVFPGAELAVLPYNRVLAELPIRIGTPSALLETLAEHFVVEPAAGAVEPAVRHRFGMYCAGTWYQLTARDGVVDESDVIARLDVSVLQDRVLGPVFGIEDPRTDKQIGFVGGARGTDELARLVDSGDYAVAFSLHPTSVAELVAVAATGQVMPPKSTWFEPKLRSGLFVHPM